MIRARSAVPIAHKAAALGFGGAPARTAALNPPPATADIPATGAPPHGGMPGRPVAKPAFPSVVSNRPARYTVGHPSSTSATPDPMPRRAAVQIGATPPNDVGSVPMLMQQALEKYELLMQARRNPTLQDEI